MNNRTFHYTGHEARLLDSDAFPGVFGGGSGGRCALRQTPFKILEARHQSCKGYESAMAKNIYIGFLCQSRGCFNRHTGT